MKSSNVFKALTKLISIRQPVFVWGAPGVGKSQTLKQVASFLTAELRDIRASLLDSVDARGIPKINGDNKAHWCIPDFWPTQGRGILFLDELNAAPPLTQAALYQLVLDRQLGEYRLPDDWAIVAAGNREGDRAVTSRMPSPLANRFIHLQFDVDVDDWCQWAMGNGIVTEVAAFIRFRPALLFDFKPDRNDKAFPTPRSWEFVSNILKTQPDKAIEYDMLSGTVGEGAATELLAFLKIWRTLPNPDVVLMQPDKAAIPRDPATLYAITTAISRKATDNNIDRVVTYANRLPDEFSALLINDALMRQPSLANTRAYIEWASKHNHIMT